MEPYKRKRILFRIGDNMRLYLGLLCLLNAVILIIYYIVNGDIIEGLPICLKSSIIYSLAFLGIWFILPYIP